MNPMENAKHKSPNKVRHIEAILVPTPKPNLPNFVFKTPKKLPHEEIQKRTPVMCTAEISLNKKSPIPLPIPQICLSKSIKNQLGKNVGKHILSISPDIYKPILPYPILNDKPITILKKSLDEESPFSTDSQDSDVAVFALRSLFSSEIQIPKENKCETCGKVCKTPAALKAHYITHVDRKPFQCMMCNKYFKSENGVITHLSISHRILGLRESGNVQHYYRKDQDLNGNTSLSTIPDSQTQVKEAKKRPQAESSLKEGPVKRIRPNPIGGSGSDLATFSHGLPPPVKAALLADSIQEQTQEKKVIEKVVDPLTIDHNKQFGDLNWPCSECETILAFKHTFALHMSHFHSMRVVCETCKRVYRDENTLKLHCSAVHAN